MDNAPATGYRRQTWLRAKDSLKPGLDFFIRHSLNRVQNFEGLLVDMGGRSDLRCRHSNRLFVLRRQNCPTQMLGKGAERWVIKEYRRGKWPVQYPREVISQFNG